MSQLRIRALAVLAGTSLLGAGCTLLSGVEDLPTARQSAGGGAAQGGQATSTAGAGGAGGSGALGGAGGAGGAGLGRCGAERTPTGGTCPSECTSCSNGLCRIQCGDGDCCGATMVCPDGWHCEIQCSGLQSCQESSFTCADGYECSLHCTGSDSCQSSKFGCGESGGTCQLICGSLGASCNGTTMGCGVGKCAATCQGSDRPQVDCGASCECTTCG